MLRQRITIIFLKCVQLMIFFTSLAHMEPRVIASRDPIADREIRDPRAVRIRSPACRPGVRRAVRCARAPGTKSIRYGLYIYNESCANTNERKTLGMKDEGSVLQHPIALARASTPHQPGHSPAGQQQGLQSVVCFFCGTNKEVRFVGIRLL